MGRSAYQRTTRPRRGRRDCRGASRCSRRFSATAAPTASSRPSTATMGSAKRRDAATPPHPVQETRQKTTKKTTQCAKQVLTTKSSDGSAC